ncbi:O-acetyl-ADP-ribose deacetylase [Lactobacillus sp. ESL0785]|uniref:O-acetyl-ADP-ribose deacetylase n=1 Tax=Lactobacillus sp. ESL0785 TaxID=2983232 RepID=UPI0023F750D5|nr:O-acetyl-ADP-ribose deacetylase [Lactobacillus sp. ESL0785]WEV70801.1 O-acetyl-ADP-ribose deacetylase [Lactobacillus sp. ESL0785]
MTKIKIIQADITTLKVDAIVNAANKTLLGGLGVDGAIHQVAGPELLTECRKLHGCETGQAKITQGYHLPAKFVIHTVGPIYSGRASDDSFLRTCYNNCLNLAQEYNLHSIAFPAISTGAYGFPARRAAMIAFQAVKEWLRKNDTYKIEVIMCAFDAKTAALYQTQI